MKRKEKVQEVDIEMNVFGCMLNSKFNRFFIAAIMFLLMLFWMETDTRSRVFNIDNTLVKKYTVYSDVLSQKIGQLETQVRSLSYGLLRLAYDHDKNSTINIENYTDFPLNSFWTGKDIFDNYADLYKNRNKMHKTCLVTETKCQAKYKLLILITTHISHFKRRHTIRNTWGNDPKLRWKTVFLVGRLYDKKTLQGIGNEMEKHGDIILGDVQEDFYNLTFKVQAGFEWAVRYCKFNFVLKGDDDVFVNLPRLFAFLDDPETPKNELYSGNVQYEAKVFREGRYAIDKTEFRKKTYPRYCSGGGYVLSRDSVEKMMKVFHDVKPIRIDDAYVGQLALKAGIDVLNNNNFKMFENGKKCVYRNTTIVHHPVLSPECMRTLFLRSLKDER